MTTELRVKVTPLYERLHNAVGTLSELSTIVEYGGAGSSKSHSIAQFIVRLLDEYSGLKIAVGRKTFPAHRTSAMALIIQLLRDYGIYDEQDHNKTENTYYRNGNSILFFSMGEGESGREKIKSANFNLVWLEEATEFDVLDYRQLKLRLRNPAPEGWHNFIILSHNPIDENHWIKTELIDKDPSVITHHSTFQDNPFLSREYIKTLTNLINEDENYYRVYALGEWGRLENLVYRNWQVVDYLPQGKFCYGMDFGFVNPSVIVKVVLAEDGQLYIDERLYKTGITISDMIEHMTHEDRGDIYADPSAKQTVEEIKKAGWNCFEAEKDVKHMIDLCKRQKLNITKDSPNIIKEIRGYRYKQDKNGVVLDEPVKFNDHACDAFRYAIYGMVMRFGYATSRPVTVPQKAVSYI